MFSTLFSLALFAAIRSVVAQSNFTIYTPSLVQCQSAQITWMDTGNPPYDLLVVPANDVCSYALEDLGNQTSTSMNWTVNLAAGTLVVLSLADNIGDEAWSEAITIGASNDTSCLMSNSSAPGSPTTTSAASHSSTSPFAPVGAAGAGLASASGAISTRPFSVVTLLGPVALAVGVFTL